VRIYDALTASGILLCGYEVKRFIEPQETLKLRRSDELE
jgi:hypothetical protein